MLSGELLGELLSQWLPMVDLNHMDTAMCNTGDRQLFLSRFFKNAIFNGFENIDISDDDFYNLSENSNAFISYLDWLTLRKIRIRNLRYTRYTTLKEIHPYFFVRPLLSEVQSFTLQLPDWPPIAESTVIAESMPNLLEFTLIKANRSEDIKIIESFTKHCQKLTKLNLQRCRDLTIDTVNHVFNNCYQLKTLQWQLNKLHYDPSEVFSYPECNFRHTLTTLEFINTEKCKDLETYMLRCCPNLTKVTLSHGCTEVQMQTMVDNCPLISHLNFAQHAVTDAELRILSDHCDNLTTCIMWKSNLLSDEAMQYFVQKRGHQLQSLTFTLSYCMYKTTMTNKTIQYIGEHCNQLVQITIADEESLDVQLFADLCRNNSNTLREITLYAIKKNSNAIVRAVAENCLELRSLSFQQHEKKLDLTDETLVLLARNCRHIEVLLVGKAANITDIAITTLAEHCCHLRTVNVSGAVQLTDISVVSLSLHCPLLNTVNVAGCSKLTDLSVLSLLKHCKELYSLFIGGTKTTVRVLELIGGKECRNVTFLCVGMTQFPKAAENKLKALRPQLKYLDC